MVDFQCYAPHKDKSRGMNEWSTVQSSESELSELYYIDILPPYQFSRYYAFFFELGKK